MDYYERSSKLSMISDKINNEFSGSMILRYASEIAYNIDKGLSIDVRDIAFLYVGITIYLDKHGVKPEELKENIDKAVDSLFSFYCCNCDGKRNIHNTCESQEDKDGMD